MKKTIFLLLLLILSISFANAATYYVSTTGNNTNPGTESHPFLTIQKGAVTAVAGDTVIVNAGTYAERITTINNDVEFKANGSVVMNGFMISNSNITIDGFEVTGAADIGYNKGAIFVRTSGSYCEIINNYLHDLNNITGSIGGIVFEAGGSLPSESAQNCRIINNTIENTTFHKIHIRGSQHLIEGNTIKGFSFEDVFRVYGSNHIFRRNILIDNWGTGHVDIIQVLGNNGDETYDILFEENYIENTFESYTAITQMTAFSQVNLGTIRDMTFIGNVYINLGFGGSVNIPGTTWINNTFYKTGHSSGKVLNFGAVPTTGYANDTTVINNAFIESGGDPTSQSNGWYSISDELKNSFYANNNFVYGTPTGGNPSGSKNISGCSEPYPDTSFCETDGINGGNPLFKSESNFLGPDSKPFTTDDGLIPYSNSNLCINGENGTFIGAYECAGCEEIPAPDPIAYIVSDKDQGYEDLEVIFNADKSLPCGSSASYLWNFGDNTTGTGENVTHTFSAGTYTVTLTVTNNHGKTSSATKTITVFPSAEPNLLLLLNFNNNIIDWSGKENDGEWSDQESYAPEGKFLQSGLFDGTSNGPEVNVYPKVPIDGTNALTISFWAKKNTSSEQETVIQKHTSYTIQLLSSGISAKIWTTDFSNGKTITTQVENNDTAWHHYAITYDASTIKTYFDNDLVLSQAFTGTVSSSGRKLGIGKNNWGDSFNGLIDELKIYDRALTASDVNALFSGPSTVSTSCLALEGYDCTLNGFCEGTILDAADTDKCCSQTCSNTRLSPRGLKVHLDFEDSISDLEFNDVSGNSNNADCQTSFYVNNDSSDDLITANQCPSISNGPFSNGAASFTGVVCNLSSDYLSIETNQTIDNLPKGTISIWAYFNPGNDSAFLAPYTQPRIQNLLDSLNETSLGTWMLGKSATPQTRLSISNGTTKEDVLLFDDSDVSGSWNHYAATWDGINFNAYYNGELVDTSPQSVSALIVEDYIAVGALKHNVARNTYTNNCRSYYPDSIPYNGYSPSQKFVMPNGAFLVGKIDDVRIYDRPLEPIEIYHLATGESTTEPSPPTNPICSQFLDRYTREQILTHKNSWLTRNLTLTELIRRAKIWKHCN